MPETKDGRSEAARRFLSETISLGGERKPIYQLFGELNRMLVPYLREEADGMPHEHIQMIYDIMGKLLTVKDSFVRVAAEGTPMASIFGNPERGDNLNIALFSTTLSEAKAIIQKEHRGLARQIDKILDHHSRAFGTNITEFPGKG